MLTHHSICDFLDEPEEGRSNGFTKGCSATLSCPPLGVRLCLEVVEVVEAEEVEGPEDADRAGRDPREPRDDREVREEEEEEEEELCAGGSDTEGMSVTPPPSFSTRRGFRTGEKDGVCWGGCLEAREVLLLLLLPLPPLLAVPPSPLRVLQVLLVLLVLLLWRLRLCSAFDLSDSLFDPP